MPSPKEVKDGIFCASVLRTEAAGAVNSKQDHTIPCAIIAVATFRKPATLAPVT